VVGDEVQQAVGEEEDRAEPRLAQARGAGGDHVEDRPGVGGRARDDPQDGGGRLLLVEDGPQVLRQARSPGALTRAGSFHVLFFLCPAGTTNRDNSPRRQPTPNFHSRPK
jgi:hypothetical protein